METCTETPGHAHGYGKGKAECANTTSVHVLLLIHTEKVAVRERGEGTHLRLQWFESSPATLPPLPPLPPLLATPLFASREAPAPRCKCGPLEAAGRRTFIHFVAAKLVGDEGVVAG